MKLFLDENITPKALEFFESLGYDVVSVQSLRKRGLDDTDVFKEALRQNRILITQNGKHFIIQVPPIVAGVKHEGLFWVKYDITRNIVEEVCKEFHDFLTVVETFTNEIWLHEVENMQRFFKQYYPVTFSRF